MTKIIVRPPYVKKSLRKILRFFKKMYIKITNVKIAEVGRQKYAEKSRIPKIYGLTLKDF